MAIFSKLKGSKEKKDTKAPKDDEPKAPVKREPYIPRYAVRDALQCAPTSWKQDSYDAFRKAHQERFAREQGEMHNNGWSNPKLSSRLSMSRNSSALSVAMMDSSRPSSSRGHSAHPTGFASSSSSYVSVSGLAAGDVPVPAIPAQYTSQASTPGPSTPRSLSRSSSYLQPQSLEAHLQSMPLARPNPPFRHSYAHPSPTGTRKPMGHNFGSTPMESPDETPTDSRSTSPNDNVNLSSSASTSSDSSGEVVEIPSRHGSPHDSPMVTPVVAQKERIYPMDPRKLGKAPVITIEESTPPAKKYFAHSTKPIDVAPTSPQAPPQKKARFSLIRRSQAVSAH
ncbi:hypothetical protein BDZ85DRAFT_269849 [Elsinoe ampelina]|uniref:Uncharacterized protein n=1 Tax=Elsinoe ampelina TaxID=302913 RepID=A0A6A6FZ39_9PEZI|nr:hypothetical protein BDZ85DRAFT_269849 [Elsinoe ampelina]